MIIIFAIGWIEMSKVNKKLSPESVSYCAIKNIKYDDEFLYSFKDYDLNSNFNIKVFTNRVDNRFVKRNQMAWILVKSMQSPNGFNMISLKYNQILCELESSYNVLDSTRKVTTYRLNEEESIKMNPECVWKITSDDWKQFRIVNSYSEQDLTDSSSFQRLSHTKRRNVFTQSVGSEEQTSLVNNSSSSSLWNFVCFPDSAALLEFLHGF